MKSPIDLFPTRQWWQDLSFHDHPPLTFFVEHWSFRLLGPTVLALRLPFVLAGLALVVVLYWLGTAMVDRRYGLLCAALGTVANYPVWLSRVGFQEGLLLVWLALALFAFLRSLDDPRWCWLVGVSAGLALLTKYSAVVALPVIFGGYLLLAPQRLRQIPAWGGAVLAAALLSPVIIYNAMLFATRGHFDATLWAMLGQQHEDFWSDDHAYTGFFHLLDWWHWLPDGFGWLLTLLAIVGAVLMTIQWCNGRLPGKGRRLGWTVGALTLSTVVLLSFAPGRKQYAALMTLPLALCAAYLLRELTGRRNGVGFAAALLALIALPTANGQLRAAPVGTSGVAYAALRPTSYAYRTLDEYLERTFSGQPSAQMITAGDVQLAGRLRARYRADLGSAPAIGGRPPIVIYDDRMDFAAVRWTMLLRDLYRYQPTMVTESLVKVFETEGVEYLEDLGFKDFRFILVEPSLLSERGGAPDSYGWRMRMIFERAGVQPSTVLTDAFGRPSFAVFQLSTLRSFITESEE
ncbi:MAG: glycosyl transferase family protein [Parcubacteria group bacterium Gr01-1014_31]|nr:MAG: glycosyl transferase family protein [Parcubacteria group bacterium Gr01-1014_31]